jgi:hypothetical protein
MNCDFVEGNRDCVVGIATRYALDGPGIESQWARGFLCSPDRLRGLSSLLYNAYPVLPRGNVAGA